ncbi:MAG TPA: hypothetical protein VHY33_09330 [Thermoanaerobaculia bacterium]|nr:hypothetical protein [Thermoanaerobaculia bacterium]
MRALLVAITFLSMSAAAQTGPCFVGIQDPPIFSLVNSNPVRVSFRNTTHFPLSFPFVTIEGNAITVVQFAPDFEVASPLCNNQSAAIGDLAPGSYIVTWQYREDVGSGLIGTFKFAFTIPEAAPCVAGLSIQPAAPAAGQPFSILYAATFRGFLQTPDVAFDGNQVAIDQSAVIGDPAFPGHVPCARGIVQFGGLEPGYYPVAVRSNSGAPMFDDVIVRAPTRSRAVRGH